jgi:hypothetical protein
MKRSAIRVLCVGIGLAVVASVGLSRAQDAKKSVKPSGQPQVVGAWTGDWGMYSPPSKTGEVSPELKKHMYPEACKQMDCLVERTPDGKWQATFEGECGRPYKYKITMQGRQAGDVVMFQGSSDLGEKDGGVFDWIGRVSNSEFVGFFTSKGYTGTFRLARK